MQRARSLVVLTLAALVVAAGATAPALAQEKLGRVRFESSCAPQAQVELDRAVAFLHSFWLDAAIRGFTAVTQADPGCGIAHWGVAMATLGNPFAWPPAPRALADGAAAVERAKSAGARTPRERDYVAAIETFYRDHERLDHRTRAVAYERAMGELAARYPQDREASIFHALALNATALPTDKTYAQQLRAAAILEAAFAAEPEHPGVAHYLIHSYDYPPIAERGLGAARRYAGIAPSAPHALHMPSHIFTRRGHWQDSIESNRASVAAAKNHFDYLHAMDYLAYAYLQGAQDAAARRVLEEAGAIGKVNVEHFVSGYALAAIPARYALERGRWADAAALEPRPADFPWARFPQAEAVTVFVRGLAAARMGQAQAARRDADRLQALRDALAAAKQGYWAEQADIQRQVVLAWTARAEGRSEEAVRLLRQAAQVEDATEKHPVTPGPVVPARELLGDLLLELGQPAQALAEYEATHRVEPGRFRGLYGAARAAELAGDRDRAKTYYTRLVSLADRADTERPELGHARLFLRGH